MDVTSLYTNIPHEEGIASVCKAYYNFHSNNPPIPTPYENYYIHEWRSSIDPINALLYKFQMTSLRNLTHTISNGVQYYTVLAFIPSLTTH